ncbi:MAG: MotA/TolQ/ExbB proton channel family protein [Planctomycetota bacterium]|nr:MotA/TolQ/ExbB proton channel family protein [Planctomycetota bacterium]
MIENGLLLERAWQRRNWKWVYLLLGLLAVTMPLATSTRLIAQDAADEDEAPEEDTAANKSAKGAKGGAKAGADAGTEETAPVVQEESYLEWLWNASGYEGLLIGFGSIGLVALAVTNIMHIRLPVFVPPDFVKDFEAKLQTRDYQGAYDLAKADDSFVAKLLTGGLGRLSKGYEEAQQGMQEVAEVSAFSVIASSEASPKPSQLAKGITLALVTTLEGLIVAIPAIIAFALFKNAQARVVLESTMAAENLLVRFSQTGKRSSGGPGAAPAAAPTTPPA